MKKGQIKAKWPNHFISGKQFKKRPNLESLAFQKGQLATLVFDSTTK